MKIIGLKISFKMNSEFPTLFTDIFMQRCEINYPYSDENHQDFDNIQWDVDTFYNFDYVDTNLAIKYFDIKSMHD